MRIVVLPAGDPLAELVRPVAAAAAERLGLPALVPELTLCLDDIAADERVWIEAGPPLTIYLHPGQLLRDLPEPGDLPPAVVWEWRRPGLAEPAPDFSRAKAERFLHHQLLLLRDLQDGTLVPERVPTAAADAFQEGWAVTVDGRLRRERLPGFPVAERRRRFSRVFASGGVLLPEHWRVFHVLWEEAPPQGEVLRLIGLLPAPRRRLAR